MYWASVVKPNFCPCFWEWVVASAGVSKPGSAAGAWPPVAVEAEPPVPAGGFPGFPGPVFSFLAPELADPDPELADPDPELADPDPKLVVFLLFPWPAAVLCVFWLSGVLVLPEVLLGLVAELVLPDLFCHLPLGLAILRPGGGLAVVCPCGGDAACAAAVTRAVAAKSKRIFVMRFMAVLL
jgi:hypothetical protein